MRTTLLVVLVGGLVLMGTSASVVAREQSLEIKLTVEERLGVARVNEPITSGIPLPKGAIEDPRAFRLVDSAGKVVPAHLGVATRWWPGKSIKWLHVDFAASVPANGTETYILEMGTAPPLKTPLTVRKKDEGYEVNTGPLKFTVKARGFNLFDEVLLNGKVLVPAGHAGGIELENAEGTFSPANFADTTVTIEEQSPLKVVLLVVSRNVAPDGSGYAMDSRTRIYAYANSPLVKVVHTMENRRGRWSEHIDVADWKMVLQTTLGSGLRYRLGLADKDVAGSLGGGQEARLDVLATDLYEFSGMASGKGNPHQEEPPRIGTLDLSGSEGGVTVGVKNFWQMWSKYLAADDGGNLTVGLCTDRVRDKGLTTLVEEQGQCRFFAGVGRTHEIYFYFHGPDEKDPIVRVAPSREPLFGRCEPAWYCRGTKVFRDLAEADLSIYKPEWQSAVNDLNVWAEGAVSRPMERWRTTRAGKIDSYGMLNYGDGVEEIDGDGKTPERVHWEGGYYDYMHSILLNFARTGNLYYLWLANDQSRHNAEVHHTHHDERPGHSRYCPSYAHIIMPDRGYYASGTFNHWKNLSVFERWYLLGDHRAREAALEITQWAEKLGNSGIDFGQPRSIGHGIFGFHAAWDATGEQKYLDAMASFARATAKKLETRNMGSGGWQRGMALHGLCWYVETTGDDSIVPMIVKHLERDFSGGASELAYPAVFMWKRTGDPKYFYKAVSHLGGEVKRWMQRFGNQGRSKLYVPWIVLKDAQPAPLPPK